MSLCIKSSLRVIVLTERKGLVLVYLLIIYFLYIYLGGIFACNVFFGFYDFIRVSVRIFSVQIFVQCQSVWLFCSVDEVISNMKSWIVIFEDVLSSGQSVFCFCFIFF